MNKPRTASIEALEPRALFSAAPTGGLSSLTFAVTAGGAGKDRANDVAVDAAGNSYLAGVYNGPVDFDPSAATANLPGTGSDDAFLVKYSPAGKLVWAKALTGVGTQEIQSVAVDPGGNVIATGYFDSTVDFDPGPNVHRLSSRGTEDAFVLKLSATGAFQWVRQFGGAGREGGVSVTTDRSANVYVQGMFNSAVEFGPAPGTARLSPAGGFDDYVVKLSSSGSFAFVRRFGGSGDEFANGIAVDSAGNIVTTGTFTGTADFDPGERRVADQRRRDGRLRLQNFPGRRLRLREAGRRARERQCRRRPGRRGRQHLCRRRLHRHVGFRPGSGHFQPGQRRGQPRRVRGEIQRVRQKNLGPRHRRRTLRRSRRPRVGPRGKCSHHRFVHRVRRLRPRSGGADVDERRQQPGRVRPGTVVGRRLRVGRRFQRRQRRR